MVPQYNGQIVLDWTMIHTKTKKNIPFGEKGSVQEALIASTELPDPFYGKNEEAFQWIENFNWELFSTFEWSGDAKNEVDLEFPSVDTYAKIYLNNILIGETENAYITYRFSIKDNLLKGKNTIRVVFESPITYQKKHLAEMGTVLPAPNDVGKIKVAPLCRKPQYQFGWDWSLRMTTMGFWKPAKIITYTSNRVVGKNSQTVQIKENEALQSFTLSLRKETTDTLNWSSSLFGNQQFVNKNKTESISRIVRIASPKLWWPRGQGDAHIYTDHWIVSNQKGEVLYEQDVKFGVKQAELIQDKDQWGVSYQVKMNGRPIFCKGSDYIPDDIFPARIPEEKIKKNVQTMADCNFNMVRVWGGGFYPDEAFFDSCDSLGIMVWQDFMFACAMYPGTDAFIANVQREFEEQIPRIASHPSVVLFNGNNEVDVAWKNWGFKQTFSLSKKDEVLIQTYYDRLFKQVLPDLVQRYTLIPYVHTSPLSNWGKEEFYNSGSQHYWGVWHGKDPIEDFGRKSGRFNAEYGFQSFPEYATLASFSAAKDWTLNSDVMRAHQKSYVGNQMIAKHSDILYGKTDDFKEFVYFSQLTQAKAVGIAIAAHRLGYPKCTGTLYWQFNDCWPAPTWSSIDYFGNWKALQYQVKSDYQDVTILEKTDTLGKEKYYLISDSPDGFQLQLNLKVYALSGTQLDSTECKLAVLNASHVQIFENELSKYKNQSIYFTISARSSSGFYFSRSFYRDRAPIKKADAKSISINLAYVDEATKKGKLIITNSEFVRDLWIYSDKAGFHANSNFISLLPGTHTIDFDYISDWKLADLQIIWR